MKFLFILFIDCIYCFQVAFCGSFLGSVCAVGIIVGVLFPPSYMIFGWYIIILSSFHFLEYFVTALTNPRNLSLDSYLLNHSFAYWFAAIVSWVEFFVERWIYPNFKEAWYFSLIGVVLCILGEIFRKMAMFTAKTNFNHLVQIKKQEGHELITNGVYRLVRHPSYVGWFWWSIGTQVVLLNPICAVVYAISSWNFFHNRIHFEEMTLIKFFGTRYLNYQKKVGTGLPFINGFIYSCND